ncbi:synaptotagmin-4-like [Phragmites australis]|uniref:synaptotagmin-4-like n=1 Tax=Phragmites australis TaxID=29695 RepID=UPI002D7A0190|nr:synaptotagmin-4-like [Phragmites australis]XP_062192185.1 synaptotagmin-4-like [Phragmites australis]XP_062192191.1 synaptotagmin-4-like [Phragmites australis]XP_062192199.1 synaptotagmin-4-like [Phragmites australis]XP_062192206.1 synaptotagmin-4-like [Phragmites australis]XP_062192214.1 synaptotagmin-4-like [Phragmites australis]
MVKKLKELYGKDAREFFNQVMVEQPLLPFLIPLGLFVWFVERWVVPFSNWVPLAAAVWATIQYGRFKRRTAVEDLNKRWKHLILNTTPTTPIEPCEWLNKLLLQVWPNYMEPKLSRRFQSTVERRLKNRKPKLIDKIELQEFSLGSCPPTLGDQGMRWITSGDQQVMCLGFDWNSHEMSVMFLAKLAKPLIGTCRIVINSIHIKGDLLLSPILDGEAILYSFESTPEVRIGVAFGSGGSQAIPGMELPGVSTWLVKLLTETIVKTMVEPRRLCFSLPSVDLGKRAVGGVLSVTVVSASNLGKRSTAIELGNHQSSSGGTMSGIADNKVSQTFVELEVGSLMRKTSTCKGPNPTWNSTFNMVLHGETGVVKFLLYELDSGGVKFNYLTGCEIKVKYVHDGSTMFWAIGHNSGVVAKHTEHCGQEVGMVVPFEGIQGELTVSLVLKEWQFSDGSVTLSNSPSNGLQSPLDGSPRSQSRTGRKLRVKVVEGRALTANSRSAKCDPYVKLHYGKAIYRTKTLSHTVRPVWNDKFEFDEIVGGEYLKIKCYSADIFGDESIGSARVNLEGLLDGASRDVWVPLEKVNSGEIRLEIEPIKNDHNNSMQSSSSIVESGWIELVIIEARDLVAADLRGTSDPYVRVQYGNRKKRTKVIYKTLSPQWNQTFEFPETGEPLTLHVKDHNAVLPTASIGHCTVEYSMLSRNQSAKKWIPLQGVRSGEIYVKIARRVPDLQKKTTLGTDASGEGHKISTQMRDSLKKFTGLIDEGGDPEALSLAVTEMEGIQGEQELYIDQLEREKAMLLHKTHELGSEIIRTSSGPPKTPY